MVYNNSVYLFFTNFISVLLYFFFPRSGGWILRTFVWEFQYAIVLVAGNDMAWLHFSNPDNCCNKRFVITQCQNEVYLYLWMNWWSCPQSLIKDTSSTGFIWRDKLKIWLVWHVFTQFHILIPCSTLSFFLFFIVFNVERFVNSGYLDKKFLVFYHAYLHIKTPGQTCSLLSVTIVTLSLFLFPTTEVEGCSSLSG